MSSDTDRVQVVTDRWYVSSGDGTASVSMSSESTSSESTIGINCQITRYKKMAPIQEIDTNTEKWYRYKRSVRIQENDTDTGDWYEYMKIMQF